jgi:glycosyltransferase involved in cell wall biosynthesis
MPDRLPVSVIAPVFNDVKGLTKLLDALDHQTFDEPFEVLIADNGSSDDPAAVVDQHARARLLHETRQSSYAARNKAAGEARGEIYAFIDSDCLPAPDWLERGVTHLREAGRKAFIGGRVDIYLEHDGAPRPFEIYEMGHAFNQKAYMEDGRYSGAGNLFIYADAFHEIGRFNDTMISSGDREFGQRAHDRGLTGVYADDAVVGHPARATFAEHRKKVARLQHGNAQHRKVRGERFGLIGFVRMLRPPVRSTAKDLRRLPERRIDRRLTFIAATLTLHYRHAYDAARLAARGRGRG